MTRKEEPQQDESITSRIDADVKENEPNFFHSDHVFNIDIERNCCISLFMHASDR